MSSIAVRNDLSTRSDTTGDPPRWLLYALAGAFMVALGALFLAPGGTVLDRLRALMGGICAQLPTHTFSPGGQRLPLCSRNTGIYLGFSLTTITQFVRGRWRAARLPSGWVAAALLAGVAIMGVDGFNSVFVDLHLPHLYQPNNYLRLATGTLTGTAMAAFLLPVANGILWRKSDGRTLYPSLQKLVWMVPVLFGAWLAVTLNWGLLLYPIALLSSAGVIVALTLINLTFVLAISGKVERYQRLIQAVPVFALAMTLAVSELFGLFLLNQALLHTIGA
ncbi:MAG TPA: DUF2085 domain-containing protein [Ktedonobacterales bacterium]|nr:DUF2085 domain-containing protein [Ktedonobacterales bacterium]